jgi:hypothetical protein
LWENIYVSTYIAKGKYTFKIIQIIAKLDGILSSKLNINLLLFKVQLKSLIMWFHKKHSDNFLIQMNVNVLKKSFSFER